MIFLLLRRFHFFFFFFFNDTATTEIYTLSLHDALPISRRVVPGKARRLRLAGAAVQGNCVGDQDDCCHDVGRHHVAGDRKSTRLNSSHGYISYAVFCLKKKKKEKKQ